MSKLIETFGSRTAMALPAAAAVLGGAALILISLDPSRSAAPWPVCIAVLGMSLNALTCLIYSLGAFAYSPAVRGTGLGGAGAIGRVGAMASSYSAVVVLAVGNDAFIISIVATALISAAFVMTIQQQIPSD